MPMPIRRRALRTQLSTISLTSRHPCMTRVQHPSLTTTRPRIEPPAAPPLVMHHQTAICTPGKPAVLSSHDRLDCLPPQGCHHLYADPLGASWVLTCFAPRLRLGLWTHLVISATGWENAFISAPQKLWNFSLIASYNLGDIAPLGPTAEPIVLHW